MFYKVIDAFALFNDEYERAAAAEDIFGGKYADMITLFEAGSEGLKQYAQDAYDKGLIVSEENMNALAEVNSAFEDLDAQMEELKTEFVMHLLPAITSIIEALSEIISWIKQILAEVKSAAPTRSGVSSDGGMYFVTDSVTTWDYEE